MVSKKKMPSIEEEELNKVFPDINKIVIACSKCPALIHASNILNKANKCVTEYKSKAKINKLNILIPEYLKYLDAQLGIKMDISQCTCESFVSTDKPTIDRCISKRVSLLNAYYRFFENNDIEGKSSFDSRSKIRSTILEEFMYFLFKDFVSLLLKESGSEIGVIKNGNADAYSNLYFTSSDIKQFIISPSFEINTKQQDYAIYREVNIRISDDKNSERIANIPLLAIENKTFLDKTMLEGAIATAEKIKMGAPYSIYIVATETYAVKFDVDPVYSRIDQIFVLRKCKHNKENRLPQDINESVVNQMFWYVVSKLMRPWSAVEKKLVESGMII